MRLPCALALCSLVLLSACGDSGGQRSIARSGDAGVASSSGSTASSGGGNSSSGGAPVTPARSACEEAYAQLYPQPGLQTVEARERLLPLSSASC
jgi:hypothetical protein